MFLMSTDTWYHLGQGHAISHHSRTHRAYNPAIIRSIGYLLALDQRDCDINTSRTRYLNTSDGSPTHSIPVWSGMPRAYRYAGRDAQVAFWACGGCAAAQRADEISQTGKNCVHD
jgi:hypothetical protein